MRGNPRAGAAGLPAGGRLSWRVALVSLAVGLCMAGMARAADEAAPRDAATAGETSGPSENYAKPHFFIREYRVRVQGVRRLPKLEVEKTVYPFLGPERTVEDIEMARSALEKAYQDKGYQTVAVQAPPHPSAKGVVMLKVLEGQVGRLRVHGSRYYSLDRIKEEAPSLAEGGVPDFNEVSKDILALNSLSDRRVTPALNAGKKPGQVDVDLNVKDTFPMHGSVELNNRYSADTTSLRLNTSLSYANLWQLGHTLGMSYQMSPLNFDQVSSFSAYYLAPVPGVNGLSLTLQGATQNSKVSTLGAFNVLGAGESLGARATMVLPGKKGFYHSGSLGFDYKYTKQQVMLGGLLAANPAPVTYFPFSVNYSATWLGSGAVTEFNGGPTFHVRGMGSDGARFNARRHSADSNFIYLRGDLSHTHDLPAGFQALVKAQGQVADRPLISNEQFSGGGMDTARGYLESMVTGDNAIFGTVELRSPSISRWLWDDINEWRFYAFTDAGRLAAKNPLPEEISHFDMASWGVGTRIRLEDHLNGALTLGVPMVQNRQYKGPSRLLTFRLSYDF